MSGRKVLGAAALAVVLAGATACGSSGGSAAGDSGPIKIVDIQDLTGVGGNLGTQAVNGAKVAVSVINQAGGVLGRQLQLSVADDASQAAQSVSLMQKYGPDKSVSALIGPTYTASFAADAPFAEKYGIVIVSSGSTAPWKGAFNKWTFRSSVPGAAYLDKLVTTVVAQTQAKSVAQMWATDNPALAQQGQLLDGIFPKSGVTVVSDQTALNATTNFNSQVATIMSKKPDLVTIGLITSGAALFTEQMRAAGYKGAFMAVGSTLDDDTLYNASHGSADGLVVPTSFDVNATSPAVQAFVTAFKTAYGRVPNGQEAFGYDAVGLIANAIKTAGSTKRDAIRDALGSTTDYQGAQGGFTFNGSGDNTKPDVHLLKLTSTGFVSYP